MTLATERLDLVNVVLKHSGMLSLMVSIELGKVVDLNVIRDPRCKRAKTSRAVTVVITRFESFGVMVLESFFQRQVVELAAKSKLTVYFLLTDVEVVDVEET
jgi:hypothetical protein